MGSRVWDSCHKRIARGGLSEHCQVTRSGLALRTLGKYRLLAGLVVVIIMLTNACGRTAFARDKDAPWCPSLVPVSARPNPEAEAWIRQQLDERAGRDVVEADLLEHFKLQGPRARVLDAKFIEHILTGSLGPKIHRHGIRIRGGIVVVPVNLEDADVQYATALVDFCFERPVKAAKSSFRRSLELDGTYFLDGVSFAYARIAENFRARGSHFMSQTEEVTFQWMTAGGAVLLKKAEFAGPVDFTGLHTGFLNADQTQFLNPAPPGADLETMTIEGTARFTKASFAGPVNFSHTIIKGDFRVDAAVFEDPSPDLDNDHGANFTLLRVDGRAHFYGARFEGPVLLDGLTYQIMTRQGKPPDEWRGLLDLLWKSKYSGSAYTNLEAMFQRQGFPERANEVYIMRKIRERKDGGLWWLPWVWNRILQAFIGYGRKPWLAWLWSIGIVFLGAGLFPREKMVPIKDGRPTRDEGPAQGRSGQGRRLSVWVRSIFCGAKLNGGYYSPFWYSLDLFAPVIDLGYAKAWMPDPRAHPWLLRVMHIERLLGWIVIPLAVAAVTGLVK